MKKTAQRNLLMALACSLFFIGSIVMVRTYIKDTMNKGSVNKPGVRHTTEAERQQILNSTELITTKFGTFKRMITSQPLPNEGVVYDPKDVNKDTKVIMQEGRRFDRIPD